MTETDVLISGAGAAGLTLAIELARRGVRFRLIDKLPTPFPGSRGKGIQPRSQEIFEDLGILNRVVAAGGLYPPQREYHDDGSYEESLVVEDVAPSPAEPYHLALLVPQFLTERVMRERLAELGHAPEFGVEMTGFEQDEHGVVATLQTAHGPERVRARYLVGCDGGRSFVRSTLQLDFPGKTLGVRAVVADIVLHGLSRDAWHRFNEGDMDKQVSLCPLPGTPFFQLQAPIPLEGDIDLSAAGLQAFLDTRLAGNELRVESVSWASAYHMNARLADRYRVGRIFLAGDAAHIHPPTGGQGLNTGVQDAYNLGWKLAADLAGAPASMLDSYEEERRPVAAAMLGLSTKLLDAAKQGEMRRGREVHQLDIGYPDSPLSFEMPARSGVLLAGDRAPDAPLAGAAGQDCRLFDLLKGPQWTLLGYEPGDARFAARAGLHIHRIGTHEAIVDVERHFEHAYGLSKGDWVLVRPDGYVAAIVDAANLAALEGFLCSMGASARVQAPTE
ncbi:FAD-dependent oxidoreductase [Sphingomonas oligophenolica]|uniref:FAD-dependent oxidoreductase n=1 Tax=Sphingomonas oligophenolica TaxID=301154 RepID=A0ABU9Y956_9SPHN